MDYPRALDSSPEDRGLGVRDWRLSDCARHNFPHQPLKTAGYAG